MNIHHLALAPTITRYAMSLNPKDLNEELQTERKLTRTEAMSDANKAKNENNLSQDNAHKRITNQRKLDKRDEIAKEGSPATYEGLFSRNAKELAKDQNAGSIIDVHL